MEKLHEQQEREPESVASERRPDPGQNFQQFVSNPTNEGTSRHTVNYNTESKERSVENIGHPTGEVDSYSELKYRDEQEEKQPDTQPNTQNNNTDSNKATGNLLNSLSKFIMPAEKTNNGPIPSKNQGRDE